jgi:hypothetical protein
MSITSELRQFLDKWADYSLRNVGIQIANHIDAEVAEEYIELPKDKNGKAIHAGDKLKQENGFTKTAHSIIYRNDSLDGEPKILLKQDGDHGAFAGFNVASESYELVGPDSQEKIDAAVGVWHCEYWMGTNKLKRACDECERGIKQSGRTCLENKMLDLLRRQRELDGVK